MKNNRMLIIGLILVLALALSACAPTNVAVTAPPEAAPAETATAPAPAPEAPQQVAQVQPVVVAGTVSATRILHGLGVELTAIPETERYIPAETRALPRIGLPMNPDLELVKSHNPEYFITDSTLEERFGEAVRTQEINTIFLNTSGYNDILSSIEAMGALFGKEAAAQEMINHINTLEKEALSIAEGKEAPTVAILFGTPDNFMLATDFSFVGDLARRLNAVNITSGAGGGRAPFVPFSLETLAEANPDVILRLTHSNPAESKAMFDAAFEGNAFYAALDAVRNNRVIDLDPRYFGVVATIDAGEAIVMMAEHLYAQ